MESVGTVIKEAKQSIRSVTEGELNTSNTSQSHLYFLPSYTEGRLNTGVGKKS